MNLLGTKKKNNIEPEIVTLDIPFKAVGLSIRTGLKSVYGDLPKAYKRYMSLKEKYGIPGQKLPWEYVSLSKNFDENKTWDYLTGHVVNDIGDIPEAFISFEVPAGKYAVFPIRPGNKLFLGLAIGRVKRYIYNNWLPESKYEFAGCEFEYNNEKMFSKNPYFIDLYVAVREKGQ
jgi:predicted transcriptional regulator YdeE